MLAQTYYLLRSKLDGNYLVAYPQRTPEHPGPKYLLLFREDFEALSYLSAHGAEVRDRFAVESVLSSQVPNVLQRWGFQGTGVVQDPLLPRVEFFSYR
jgi:hypothetical protein